MKKQKYPQRTAHIQNVPSPRCGYESASKICGVEAAVAVMPSGSKTLVWLCVTHLKPWLSDHNLDLDDVL